MLLNAESPTPLADGIKNVVFEQKKNYYIMITGKLQTRKSTCAVKLAQEIQPNFDMERQLACVKTKSFLKAIRLDGLKRGYVLVLDEFGVGMSHRRWREFLINAVNYIMMTHGFKGIVVIVTVPYEDYVDKDAKMLFDMLIETLKKNDKKKYVTVKVEEMQYNQKIKKIYYKYPRVRFPDGNVEKVDCFKIWYPDKETLKRYFEISEVGKEALGADLDAQADEVEREKVKKRFSLKYYVNEVLKEPEKFTKVWQHRRFIAIEKVMNEFIGIGTRRAMQIKTAAEEKLGDKLQEGLDEDA